MEVLFLGTGGSVPTPERNTMAIAIRIGPEMVLFDCGEGTQRQFMRSQFSFMKIDRIFISHLHGDHFLGLFGLVQSMNFSGRERCLEVYGPAGIGEIVQTVMMTGHFELKFPIYWKELRPNEELRFNGHSVRTVEAQHPLAAISYILEEDERRGRFDADKARSLGVVEGPMFSRLQSGHPVTVGGRTITPRMVLGPPRPGIKIAYTGDTLPNDAFAKAAKDCDLMIHEATTADSLREKANEYGHSTSLQAAEIAIKAGARSLALVHISGRYDDVSELLDEARSVFKETFIPDDLALVEVRKQ